MEIEEKKLNVYVTGYVGNLGTKVLIEEKRDILEKHFSRDYLDKVLRDIKGGEIPSLLNYKDIIDIKKGGVLAALWDICERNKVGLSYRLCDIPILQGTIEIANFFDLNPYRLLTDNAKIIFSNDSNLPFCKIGETNSGKKRVRIDGEVEGFLTKDFKDEIDKIISKYSKRYD